MKPTIAHCRTNFLPVTETFIENQIRNLDGFDSIVLTREISERFKDKETREFKIYKKKSGRLSCLLRKMSKKEKDFFTKVVQKKNVKLLHAHFGSDAWYFLPLKKKTGLPLAVSFYGYDAYRLPKRFLGAGKSVILKAVFKHADLIIVPSEHMKKHLAGLGCDAGKIEIIPWGVEAQNLASLDDRRDAKFCVSTGRGDKVRFLSIGRMVEKKGQAYLLEAFRKVLDKGVDAELTIIGDGQLRTKLENAIDKLEIYAKVRLISKMSNEDVISEMMSHNIYLQPSAVSSDGDREGVPTAIMEAFACGLPVIATTHSGIPEIVENNVSGILVPERDSLQLADAMEKLAKNPELCEEFGQNGKKRIEEDFNGKKQTKKLEELYLKLINTDEKRMLTDHGSVIREYPFLNP